MNKRFILNPLAVAVGLALAGPSLAVTLDLSGSNIYMKFLDGNRRLASQDSIDTASGSDQGQFTELELRLKATISPQVEAGVRVQSRSSASYWTNFGFADNEGFGNAGGPKPNQAKYMKLRGAYVELTPGYRWLHTARIGGSDWGMFDPFTVGKVRYIDRDNYNGFYFKGPLPLRASSWELARVSLPSYLQSNYGQGPSCCSTDSTQYNEAVWIGQVKFPLAGAKLTASYQTFNDDVLDAGDTNPLDGTAVRTFAKNKVAMIKAEGSVAGGVDLRGAYYRSEYKAPLFDQPWIPNPKSDQNGNAYKLDLDLSSLPVSGLSVNLQYFNIGAGYFSGAAARRESDVLLTEGSEAAWYNYGNNIWLGGAARDYTQSATTPKGGLQLPGANGLTDNDFIDFDESPAESVVGWKGFTLLANYEIANTPLALEVSRINYNNNWQDYSPTGPLSAYFPLNSDRKTNIYVFKASHVFPVAGGLETSFKWKRVNDKDGVDTDISTDDRKTDDNGYTITVGNQLFRDLYGSVSWGKYNRDVTVGAQKFDNDKSITSLRFTYNLTGFEFGTLAQWIDGKGDPGQTGTQQDIKQYRLKAFMKVIF